MLTPRGIFNSGLQLLVVDDAVIPVKITIWDNNFIIIVNKYEMMVSGT